MPLLRTTTLVVLTVIQLFEPSSPTGNQDKRISAFLNGDFIIGALFPVHHQPSSKKRTVASLGIKCGEIRELYGIQRVEVTFQTLDRINKDPNLLPNLTLGVEIRDECWYAPVALQQSIELIRDAITPVSSYLDSCHNLTAASDAGQRGPLIGVVGPGSSSVALQVQNLLQLFHIPQVGYSTTSRDLSDKSRFNYFLRVVPSDYYQAQVILDIVRYYGWTYVSAVNTDENYGQSGIQAFRELAEEADVCIAREDSILSNAPDEGFDKVILNLKQDPNAYVVVCFCEGLTVRGLLKATRRLNMTNHFLFIGSDGWADRGDVTRGFEEEAWGALSIRIHSPYVKSFDEYYWSLKPHNNTRNPWFREFWESRFSCSLDGPPDDTLSIDTLLNSTQSSTVNKTDSRKLCSGEESLLDKYRQDSKLSFVIKAVYSLAHALHDMQQDKCGPGTTGTCEKLLPFNGSLFKSYLMNVTFEYDEEIIEFDENGDPPGRYDIMNYQKLEDGSFDYVQVGNWHNRSLWWNQSRPVQFGKSRNVKSVCSEECPKGHYKNVQQGGKDKRCCWVCVPCPSGEILDEEGESCHRCPQGFVPDELKLKCLQLPIEHMQWWDTQAIVAMIFASLGFLSTFFAFVVFMKYNDTPVVKSSTKELCYIILAGMSVSHASVFAILMKPSMISCALSRVLPGLSFAMMYAALLTKTNRIARILAGSKKRFPTRKPLFMSATAQVVITCFLIAIEIFISGGMLHYQFPNIAHVYSTTRTLLECDTTPEAIVVPLAFDFFLIILCTIYAVKTRNVPENFNEAKFIGFAMYTTCVIWIAFVPIYFGSDSKVITLCMCVTLSAMVIWVFLFVPKLYIILVKPERNNRALFTTSKTIRCHIGSRVASAVSEKSSNNSWKESTVSGRDVGVVPPQKRTLSCQTGNELLQVLLNPKALMEPYTVSANSFALPKITERDCCEADNCQVKKIIIELPDNPVL
ncbi:metabotropic glutamate receptor 5-like [Tribolium madens]|uniref:metabotropic glutamate receptor 5-like n=1 Tax=Tribolium madens TaxID=41895 RepID=UPI001CF74FE2|nr:metabotropic glutamate receptor 5-like [Tribolium madens]